MHISILGVILAAASAMVVGTIWYSRALFGRPWMASIGATSKDMSRRMPVATVTLSVVSLLTAYVLAHFIVFAQKYTGQGWIVCGVETALWAWLGLAGTALVAHEVFVPRDKRALYINLGNRLVTLLTMGLIIGALQ